MFAAPMWEGAGPPVLYPDKQVTTLIDGPSWEPGHAGIAIELNDGGRQGQCVEGTGLGSAYFNGLTEFTYAIYFRWIGGSSADEDALGLQWSGLQGVGDNDAKRLLMRYDSQNAEVDFYHFDSAEEGLTVSCDLSDALPHTLVFTYSVSRADKRIYLDGKSIGSTAASLGALSTNAAHSKVPEVFGGHGVTDGATDSPRVEAYGFAFHADMAWNASQVAQWAANPYGPFERDDDIPAVLAAAGAAGGGVPAARRHVILSDF